MKAKVQRGTNPTVNSQILLNTSSWSQSSTVSNEELGAVFSRPPFLVAVAKFGVAFHFGFSEENTGAGNYLNNIFIIF